MFGKTTRPPSRSNLREPRAAVAEPSEYPGPAAAAPPVPAPPRNLSTLSSELRIEGSLSGQGDLQIEGSVRGNVHVGRLIIGETGTVDGNVSADYLEIRGRVVGAVTGKQVRLIATAYVDGDITAEMLSIDIGAYFQGRVLQSRREMNPANPSKTEQAEAPVPHAGTMPSSFTTTDLSVRP